MIESKQKTIFSIILLVILITVTLDLYQDWGEGQNIKHFVTEIIVCIMVLIGLVAMWSNNLFLKNELKNKNLELTQTKAEALKWKNENDQHIKGLSFAIDKKFEEWSLSPSEKDVALLLLKGLSLKEIAEIRTVSERTVRQQSINIYQKANLSGRAELSAFFLEDLLAGN